MQQLVEKFYTAFKNLDSETMVSCYHDDVVFKDPAFGILKGEKAKNMWRMLCESQKGKKFVVKASAIVRKEDKVTAHWEAHYIFQRTGRNVHNIIAAEFEFKEGKIINHTDHFNLHKWARQAIGFKGFLLGGTHFFKNKLHSQTNHLLLKYEENSSKN